MGPAQAGSREDAVKQQGCVASSPTRAPACTRQLDPPASTLPAASRPPAVRAAWRTPSRWCCCASRPRWSTRRPPSGGWLTATAPCCRRLPSCKSTQTAGGWKAHLSLLHYCIDFGPTVRHRSRRTGSRPLHTPRRLPLRPAPPPPRHNPQEAAYNIGRAAHQLGLLHIATPYYQRVLEAGPPPGAPTSAGARACAVDGWVGGMRCGTKRLR